MKAIIKKMVEDRGNLNIHVDYVNDKGEVIKSEQYYVADKDETVNEVKSKIKSNLQKSNYFKQPEKITEKLTFKTKVLKKGDIISR